MSRFSAVLVAALAFSSLSVLGGCPQPIEQAPCDSDGGDHGGGGNGNDGGGGMNGGTDGGSGGGTDGGGGGTDGGGGGIDGGNAGVSRADAGPFSWAAIPGTTTNETIYAVHGTSVNNVYEVGSKGQIRHSSGGAFSDVYVGPASSPPSLHGLWVAPNGNVFAGGTSVLIACTNNNCVQQSDFTVTNTGDLAPMYGSIESICGRGNDLVYAVGNYNSEGRVWQYDFASNTWVVRIANTQTSSARGCFIADNGDMFVASGNGKVLRVTPAFLSFIEPVNAVSGFDPSTFSTYDVNGTTGQLFAAGTDKKIIQRDPATKTWNLIVNPPSTFYDDYALGGFAQDELYASGDPSTDKSLQRYDGNKWSFVTDTDPRHLPYYMIVYDIWMPNADTVFIAGERSFDGIVVMGTR